MPYLSHRLDTRAVILLPASILEAGDPLFSCLAMSKTDTSLVSDVAFLSILPVSGLEELVSSSTSIVDLASERA